ncbi:MAG: hypothetical protein AAF226_13550 [Verrucomicrobiota bacterium]
MKRWISGVLAIVVFGAMCQAQQRIKKEIDVSFAPLSVVKPIMEKTLSSSGQFVLMPKKGTALVIDTPDRIAAAEAAMNVAPLPNPDVSLKFGFRTGMAPRTNSIFVGREMYYPTGWDAPQIPSTVGLINGGSIPYAPAHPTGFVKREVGFKSTTTTSVNPDGTLNVDVNMENTEFEGFINYGSSFLPSGGIGTVPVGVATNPTGFQQYVPNNILMPIFSTTRIKTSIVVRPNVSQGQVQLDMMPQLTFPAPEEEGAEDIVVNLKQYRTTMPLANGQKNRVYGFTNASAEFNRNFLGAEDLKKGGTAIEVTADIRRGKAVDLNEFNEVGSDTNPVVTK